MERRIPGKNGEGTPRIPRVFGCWECLRLLPETSGIKKRSVQDNYSMPSVLTRELATFSHKVFSSVISPLGQRG